MFHTTIQYRTLTLAAIVLAAACCAIAQTTDPKTSVKTQTAGAASPQTVNAQQSGPWTVGIDPAKNVVRLDNTSSNPVPVKVIETSSGRRAFQARVIVNPQGEGIASALLQIPAGKRLIVENVSAIARIPEGLRMEVNFFTYIDNNNDGVGDISDIVFHRITLTEQGTFGGVAVSTANHHVLVFADEQIGTGHFGLTLQARLNATAPPNSTSQAQVTISGYVEDIPPAQ